MEKKYELTEDVIDYSFIFPDHHSMTEKKGPPIRLYRIRALRDFGNVKAGDLGGYIEEESNLSHDGNCWIGDNAKVSMWSKVSSNAHIFNDAELTDWVKVHGNAKIYGKAKLSGHTEVFGKSEIYGEVETEHAAKIYGNAKVFDKAKILDWAHVFGNAKIERETISGHNRISKTPIKYTFATYDIDPYDSNPYDSNPYDFEKYYMYEKMYEEKCTLNLFEKYIKRGTLIGLIHLIIDFFIARKKLK